MPISNPKLRINFFVQFVYEQGTYFRFHNLAKGLTNLGHNITIWGTDFNKKAKSIDKWERDGITYIVISGNRLQSFFGQHSHPLTTLRRILLNYPPADVNHSFQPFLSVAAPWRLKFKNAGINVYDWDDLWNGGLFSKHSITINNFWSLKWVAYCEKRLPRIADLTTVCSSFLENKAKSYQAKKVVTLYNGYWPKDKITTKADARTKLGLHPHAFYLGFMGRTHNEISWCFDGLKQSMDINPSLRLALCGCGDYVLDNLDKDLLSRIDYLGFLNPQQAEDFAAAITIGLLPLEDDAFNNSRFPIKLAHYQAMGTPVLFSNIGETGKVASLFPWNINAGKTYLSWLQAFSASSTQSFINGLPKVDTQKLADVLSWDLISLQLEQAYYTTLSSKK